MSQRERWIIYPLLFLTFCLAIRDQWPLTKTDSPSLDVVQCKSLLITDDHGNPTVTIGTWPPGAEGAGEIKIKGQGAGAARPLAVRLGYAGGRGIVETYGSLGMAQAQLTSNRQDVGTLALYDKHGNPVEAGNKEKAPNDDAADCRAVQDHSSTDPRQATPRPPTPPLGPSKAAPSEN